VDNLLSTSILSSDSGVVLIHFVSFEVIVILIIQIGDSCTTNKSRSTKGQPRPHGVTSHVNIVVLAAGGAEGRVVTG